MRLFHFMRKEYAVQNVQKSRLKIATLNDMNDPYEFYLRIEDASEQQIEDIKNHYNEKVGFICFSRRLGNPVQWAHYADNHRGVCMEFNIPEKLLLKVKYIKSPTLISAKNPEWKDAFVKETLCKYNGWRYEKEYRISINLESDDVVKEDGLYFTEFLRKFTPCNIYTGIRCELSEEDSALFSSNGIPVVRMVQHNNSYLIVRA